MAYFNRGKWAGNDGHDYMDKAKNLLEWPTYRVLTPDPIGEYKAKLISMPQQGHVLLSSMACLKYTKRTSPLDQLFLAETVLHTR